MRIKICIKYTQYPELAALRFNPGISIQGLTKQVLSAYINKREFPIYIQKDVEYVKKPLIFYLVLDNETDKEIIQYLNSQCVPAPAFIRNLLLRSIKGDLDYVYRDFKLKKLALYDESTNQADKADEALRAIMARSRKNDEDQGKEDVLLSAAMELRKDIVDLYE